MTDVWPGRQVLYGIGCIRLYLNICAVVRTGPCDSVAGYQSWRWRVSRVTARISSAGCTDTRVASHHPMSHYSRMPHLAGNPAGAARMRSSRAVTRWRTRKTHTHTADLITRFTTGCTHMTASIHFTTHLHHMHAGMWIAKRHHANSVTGMHGLVAQRIASRRIRELLAHLRQGRYWIKIRTHGVQATKSTANVVRIERHVVRWLTHVYGRPATRERSTGGTAAQRWHYCRIPRIIRIYHRRLLLWRLLLLLL